MLPKLMSGILRQYEKDISIYVKIIHALHFYQKIGAVTMKRMNMFVVTILSSMLLVGMSACSQSSEEDAAKQSEPDSISASTDDSLQSDDPSVDSTTASDESEKDQSDETSTENSRPESPGQDDTVTKTKGKQAYLEKLDNIQ
jgi:hypothetical protein